MSDHHKQTAAFNRLHRIREDEPIAFGFRDAGRGTPFDEAGAPLAPFSREVMVARHPDTDPGLADAIDQARLATVGLSDWEAIDQLADLVAGLLPVNDPAANTRLLETLVLPQPLAGAEISLGELIGARTGVCRHRALLFKVLADAVGVRAALVRGNYVRHGADRGPGGEDEGAPGGHAWNEVVLSSGERILVDVMHNLITDLGDPVIANYSDVNDAPLYPQAVRAAGSVAAIPPSGAIAARDLAAVRGASWFVVTSPAGGRSAYVYTDAMAAPERRRLRRALRRLAIHFDRYRTGFGGDGGKRNVLRVRGAGLLLLRRTGADLQQGGLPPKRNASPEMPKEER